MSQRCIAGQHTLQSEQQRPDALTPLHRQLAKVKKFQHSSTAANDVDGSAGMHRRWSPDGLSVVLVADFCVRMTVWSLVDRKCMYLPGPKQAAKGIAFSPRADQLAVLEVGSWCCCVGNAVVASFLMLS
jgi:hypothetical protein